MNHALGVQTWVAEVKQQAEMQASRLEIVDALQTMRIVQCFDHLQLDQNRILDQQIHEILADHNTIVYDRGATLLCDSESRRPQLVRQRVLIGLCQKPGRERIENHEGVTDNDLRQFMQPWDYLRAWRASACIRVKTFCDAASKWLPGC